MNRVRTIVSLLVCLWAASGIAAAQGTSVSGVVVDPQGAVIVGAAVTLAGGSAAPATARSNEQGTFEFSGVAPGSYTLAVEAEGFARYESVLRVGTSPVRARAMLQIGGVAQDVTVRGAIVGTAATGKTSVPLRDLPLTIDSVSRDVVEAQGANDLVTALRNVPGVNPFTTYGVYEYYNFRGFLDSVQLVDGVRNEGNRINTQLTNIERIEVLKGPSSALYGGGALGATVNLIRRKPSAARAYDFTGAFGSWGTGRGSLGASGRAGSDRLLYRFDAGAERRDGYRHDDARRVTITPSFAFGFGQNDQVNVYYSYDHNSFGGDAGLPLVDTGLGVPTRSNIPDVPRDRNYRTPFDNASGNDHNLQLVYARQLNDRFGFRDTFGYRHFNDKYFLSEEVDFIAPRTVDRYYLFFFHHRRPIINIAEVTTHVSRGVQQDLLFGWEAQRYHNYTDLPEEDFFDAASIDAFDPVETQGPSDLTITRSNVFTNVTNAFYVNDHLTLGPKVKALLGGRFDVYRRSSHTDAVSGGNRTAGPESKRDAEAFTGRAGIVYQPRPTIDLYGSFANAFTPPTLAQPDGTSLDPITGNQIEAGQRLRLFDERAEVDLSVYRLAKQHVPFRRPGNVYVQAGEVRSAGFEAEVTTTLRDALRLNASYAFTDAEFLDYEESPGTNLRGNTPVFAPRHTFNLWTSYEWPNGIGANIGVRALSGFFADNGNEFSVDGYATVAAAVRYRRGPAEFALNINNLTDTEYLIPHQDYLQVYPGEPINALATVRIRLR